MFAFMQMSNGLPGNCIVPDFRVLILPGRMSTGPFSLSIGSDWIWCGGFE